MNCAKKKKFEDLWRCNNINHEKGHRLKRQNLKGRQIISVQESIRNVSKYICSDRIEGYTVGMQRTNGYNRES